MPPAIRLWSLILQTLLLAACGRSEAPNVPGAADAVYQNGRIYTVDPQRSWAEAVAITAGRLSYVGSNEGATDYKGPNTTVVDLGGRLMLPAFQDAHIHPITGGLEALACDLNDLYSLEDYRSTIAAYAAANPDVPWILGGGWSMAVFGPGGRANRAILDELIPDRPVFLESADGHTGWANSRALEIAGITKDTPDPRDGIIDRDPETGEPIGSLQEDAMDIVEAHIPPTSLASRVAALRYTRDMLHGYGITSITAANVTPERLEAYAALDARDELGLRVVTSLKWDNDRGVEQIDDFVAQREQHTKGNVHASTVKIFQDGVLENFTGAMLEPYDIPSHSRGIPMVEPELLKRAVTQLDARDFQVHFHAIGDAAIRQSLDAVEEALIENGQRNNRHHIAHAQVVHPNDVARFSELNVTANFQPLWAYADSYVLELNLPFIGEERTSWMYPMKSIQEAGGRIAFGSDWSVSSANPFIGIATAITRLSQFGETQVEFTPWERIDLESAIAAYTIDAAYVNWQEVNTGSIETGKLADLIVLDRNVLEIEPADISDTRVLLTLFAGDPVYGNLDQF
ncbi:MAG: amidohydrolase [Woeseiaceae bacterium]|nr:amidohydrolase [Woeseiaceae bacterium]